MSRSRFHTAADYAVMAQFGAAVRRARIDVDVRRQDMADHVGLTLSSVSNIENGRQNAPLTVLARIADAVHMPLSTLLLRGGL